MYLNPAGWFRPAQATPGAEGVLVASQRLDFFVELAAEPLVSLFERPEVTSFLADGGHAVSMGLLDLSPERAQVVRDLETRGIPVTGWLLLDVRDGYWLNADNTEAARARYHQTIAWTEREGLRLHRIGLDIEFPRNEAEGLLLDRRRALWSMLRRRRSRDQVEQAERAYTELVDEIRRGGRSVESYQFPYLLDERAAKSTLLRRTLGLVDIAVDFEVYMLYASYLGRAGAHAYFQDAPCIALGVTGGGVHQAQPAEVRPLLSWQRLEEDLRAAVAASPHVYVFSLEGCVEQGFLERIAVMSWDEPPPTLAAAEERRAGRRRFLTRTLLRAERLLDAWLPSRPGRAR